MGSVSLPTTLDQTYRYAGASGDRSPMHVDDEMARSLGFPRKFNQGLCTLAVTSRGLIDLAAGGDPRRIRRIAVRFSSPSYPGDAIDLSVFKVAGGEGNRVFAFETSSGGAMTLRHGLVEVDRLEQMGLVAGLVPPLIEGPSVLVCRSAKPSRTRSPSIGSSRRDRSESSMFSPILLATQSSMDPEA